MAKELVDTVNDMVSDDYAKRLKAEIEQLQIRTNALADIVRDYDSLEFIPKTPLSVLQRQLSVMMKYEAILVYRYSLESKEGGNDGN